MEELFENYDSEEALRSFVNKFILETVYEWSNGGAVLKIEDRRNLELGRELLNSYFDIVRLKLIHGLDHEGTTDASFYAMALNNVILGVFLIGLHGTLNQSGKDFIRFKGTEPARLAIKNTRDLKESIIRKHFDIAKKSKTGRLRSKARLLEDINNELKTTKRSEDVAEFLEPIEERALGRYLTAIKVEKGETQKKGKKKRTS